MLLILAGVSLSAVFSEKGIFSRAEKAGNRYNEAKAREVLETVLLADGQYEKHTNLKYNQDDFLNELIKKEIEGVEIKGDVVVIDGWAFLLDRSVPKIGEPLGRAEGLIFPTVKVSKATLAEDYRTSSFTVTAIEATNGINKIEIWLNGEKIKDLDKTYNNVKEEIEQEFTVDKNGKYTVKVYGKLMASVTVEVTGIVPAVEFTPNGNTDWKKEHQTKITVKTNETITSMKYLWTTSGTNPPVVSDFNSAELCTNNSTITGGNDTMTGTYYLWILLTTQTGEIQKTNICGSEGFNFDNEGPTVTLTSSPTSETSFTLTATASDIKSGIAKYEFYVDGKKVNTQITTEGTAIYTWNGTEMRENVQIGVKVFDLAENVSTSNIYDARTKLYTWETYDVIKETKYREKVSREVLELFVPTGTGAGFVDTYKQKSFDISTGKFELSGSRLATSIYTASDYQGNTCIGRYYTPDFGYNVYYFIKFIEEISDDRGDTVRWDVQHYYGEQYEETIQGNIKKETIRNKNENLYPKNNYEGDTWYYYIGIS